MNLLDPPIFSVTPSLALAWMAMVVAAAWACWPRHRYLLWHAASLLSLAGGYMLVLQGSPWAGGLFCAAAVAAAQALAQRLGQHLHAYLVAALAVVLGVVIWQGDPDAPSPWAPDWRVSLCLACILGQVLSRAWRSATRHRAEQWLRVLYTLCCALVLCSPWWVVQGHSNAWLLILQAGLLTAAWLACVWCDRPDLGGADQHRDALTGLLNRRGLDKACGAMPLEQQVTVLVLCDLDEFRQLEAQHGPAISNAVLRSFAQLLQQAVRDGDHVARLGEEFCLALRSISLGDAHALLQRIRTQLRQPGWLDALPAPHHLTASFGVTAVYEMDSLDIALHRADVLLYQVRDDGRDRIGLEDVAGSPIVIFS